MDFDLLALFGDNNDAETSIVAASSDSASAQLVSTDDAGAAVAQTTSTSTPRLPSQIGRVGKGRHGGEFERRLLAGHMRMSKLARKTCAFGEEVRALLDDSKFLTQAGDIIGVRARTSAGIGGIVLQLSKKAKTGNRFQRTISWSEFLESAYGRFKQNSAIGVYLGKSVSTVRNMQVFVSGAWMNQQALVIAKVVSLAASRPPLVVFKHMKFDETSLLCSLNPDKGRHNARSTWQTMVYRLRVVVVWETGENLVIPIVVPPVVMLSTGAAHQFYALNFHPSFRCVNKLVKLLQGQAQESFDILEADGASSNNRLLAHLYKLARDDNRLMSHARCMNHASQLINVALLSSLDSEALNRLYALSIFLRNLGYWGRLRQALRQWVAESLVIKQEAFDKSQLPTCDEHLQEFLDYMQFWKDLESESTDKTSKEYRSKLARVGEMCNGMSMGEGLLCHICTRQHTSQEFSHCIDREDTIRKVVDALTDLFLACMPTIPVPSKWTTMFQSLDFCLGGFILSNWLPNVFKLAFGTLQFAEFEDGAQALDPRMIEALSFSAVNGRRFRSSLGFLESATSHWMISLLSILLEPSRCLTFYWLGSLKKSLSPSHRCVLFEVLDPSESVVEGVLQHLTELAMSMTGQGRLKLLWRQYPSYEEFCLSEPGRVRQLRRGVMLMAGWIYRRQYVYMNSLQYAIAILGDPDADPDVVSRVLQAWDSKNACCIPQGVARMLKRRGLSSLDLMTPRWRTLLHWYGSTLTWTIADVEQKHAVNRLSAGSSFSTICAKYINAAAAQQRQSDADGHAKAKATAESAPFALSDSKPMNSIALKQTARKRQAGTKAQSPLELFRKDFLHKQSFMGTVNPCSKEVWREVKAQFAELPEAQRQVYDTLAADSGASATVARASVRRPSGTHASPDPRGQMMPVPVAQATTTDRQPMFQPPCHVQQMLFGDFMQAKDLQTAMRKFETLRPGSGSAVAPWTGGLIDL